MSRFTSTDSQRDAFLRDGYLVVENLLDAEEVAMLGQIARTDQALHHSAVARADGQGGAIRLKVENTLDDDIYSAVVQSRRIVKTMEHLLGGEVYHYHHKMILKDAKTGGAWEWHQDYGYWYSNGCLFPHMGSCLIAVDRATRENGCLQVLKGSHEMGRIDHGPIGDQTGADPERVAAAEKRLETVYCELAAGSAIFFHGNTLHRSDANLSDHPRWAFICCYNRADNDPYKKSKHPNYSRLEIVDDAKVSEVGVRDLTRFAHETATAP